jgi:hypothetical protein
MNTSQKDWAKLLQLWAFPDKENVTKRYNQKSFDIENQINTFVHIVSPKDKMMAMRYGFTSKRFLIWESSKKA